MRPLTATELNQALALWRQGEGFTFGPRVEHVAMPLARFGDFLARYRDSLPASPPADAARPEGEQAPDALVQRLAALKAQADKAMADADFYSGPPDQKLAILANYGDIALNLIPAVLAALRARSTVDDRDLYYLCCIARRLAAFHESVVAEPGTMLGHIALADERDWLDCFIERCGGTLPEPAFPPPEAKPNKPATVSAQVLVEAIVHVQEAKASERYRSFRDTRADGWPSMDRCKAGKPEMAVDMAGALRGMAVQVATLSRALRELIDACCHGGMRKAPSREALQRAEDAILSVEVRK